MVAVGDVVPAGAMIGRLQVFGSHCFPRSCLHWGLIEGREHYLDPLTLVGAGPVRLLPLDGALPGLLAGVPAALDHRRAARCSGCAGRRGTGQARGCAWR